ncbi:Flagellum-specific peptidoglycan hydrolase FlgJ [bacterium A37T11]|nr:Flagellum-specific peptidoglycan hydrolase FlgJ [bacterium A37T11]
MLKTKFPVAFICLFFIVTPISAQRLSALTYVKANKDRAIAFMHQFGLPASIILAVAMHESAHGNSKIARHLNNHFGIKGPNRNRRIRSAYKDYESVDESYLDFVHCLQTRPAFQQLFDKYPINDYQSWVKGIARGGYAGSRQWARQVINMIERYHLDELDSIPGQKIMQ